jgi:hypothetical protein
MNHQAATAEYTMACMECGVLFVPPNSGRPPKFCTTSCRKKSHRKLQGTKSGTKPTTERQMLNRQIDAVLKAYEKLPDPAKQFVCETLKEQIDAAEAFAKPATISTLMEDISGLSDADFLTIKTWINQGIEATP